MSEGIGLLLAIALSIGLFTLLLYLFKESSPFLRLLFIMGVLVSGFFIPTAVYQLRTECTAQVNQSSIIGNTTSYTYMNVCLTSTSNAPDTFYTVMWNIYLLLICYVVFYVLALMVIPVWEKVKRW